MKIQLKSLVCMALVLGLTAPVFAQNNMVVPYVDQATAQALVDTLVKENDSLAAANDKLDKETSALIEQVVANKKWIAELGPIQEDLKARASALATLNEQIQDRTLKAKLATAIEKNKVSDKAVSKRLGELLANVDTLQAQIDTRRTQSLLNTAKMFRNNESVILMQAALAKTKIQESTLTSVAALVDTSSAKADSFLQQSAAAVGNK